MLRINQSVYGVGVVHAAAYSKTPHDPLETTRRLLLDHHLDVVEGAWKRDGEQAEAIRAMLAWSGCDVVFVAGGTMRAQGIDPSASDPAARAAAIDKLKTIVETASWYGARMLLMCAGPDQPVHQREAGIGHLAQALRQLCRHAEKLRPNDPLWITFEHFDRALDQKRLLGPTIETATMLADIRRDCANIGMTMDMSHVLQLGEDLTAAVKIAGDLIIHAHAANCGLDQNVPAAFGDSHCRFGMPGAAATVDDVTTFLCALEANGYGTRPLPTALPTLSIEMKVADSETPELVIANGLRTLHRAAARADVLTSRQSANPRGGPRASIA